jgi:hypothetical protein
MRHLKLSILAGALLQVMASSAAAQTCLGQASFGHGGGQASVGMGFAPDTQLFAAGLTGGTDALFGGAGFGLTTLSNVNGSNKAILGGVATQARISTDAAICPTATFEVGFGPNVGRVKLRTYGSALGASFGLVVTSTPSFSVIPTIHGSFVYARMSAEIGNSRDVTSDTFGQIGLGVGLVFNQRSSLRPMVTIPIAGPSNDAMFSFSFAVNFGH